MTWETIDDAPFKNDPFSRQSDKTLLWEGLYKQIPIGTTLTGRIYARTYFAVFFDAGVGFPVRMNVTDFGKLAGAMIFPDDYPNLNSIITGQFNGFDEATRQLVVVSSQ